MRYSLCPSSAYQQPASPLPGVPASGIGCQPGGRRLQSFRATVLRNAVDYGNAVAIDRQRYLGLANFRYAVRRFLAASERLSAESGITTQQYQAMLAIGAAALAAQEGADDPPADLAGDLAERDQVS